MSITDHLRQDMKRMGLELIAEPRVAKLMQNEQLLRMLMSVVQVTGIVNDFTAEQMDRLARTRGLSTAEDVRELRRCIKRLECEVARLSDARRAG